MSHAKRYMLIEPQALERMRQQPQQAANLSDKSGLNAEMARILNMANISDEERWNLYNQHLQRYLRLTHEDRQPLSLPIIGEATESADPPPASPDLRARAVALAPKALRNKAGVLYDMLASDPALGWDATGRVSINSVSLDGSNILDLVGDLLRARKHVSPPGWRELAVHLKRRNFPLELIGNPQRRDVIMGQGVAPSAPNLPRTPPRARPALRWKPFRF